MSAALELEQSRAKGVIGFFTRLVADGVDAVVMVWDWILGRFDWSPIRLIVALVVGMAYLVSPIDIIPDAIPLAGWIDDFMVATAVIRIARADIIRWREWKFAKKGV